MFPQGFPQRMRRTAASGPGRWAGGGRRAQRLEEAGSGLTDGKNPMAPPPPGVAPPPRLAFLSNRSPGRRKTLSPVSSVQDNLDPRAMAQKPMSIAEAERMNIVAQDQIW